MWLNPHEIVVVPHTHWDREWYLPFQRFRLGLVRMLDEVLDTMDKDLDYRFTMDGQLAALEDYLEIRPDRRADLSRFVREGRFAAGPWLILADEFLCSGETLARNLEYGMRGARELGASMPVGYLPDQFGHCAQMPQILTLAGLHVACLWRGVPASVERDAFAWTAPDGTAIRTQYLPGGYGNAVALFSGPAEGLPDRLAAFTETMRRWRPEGPMLAMYGADHSAPSADITAAGLRLATLTEYLADDTTLDGLPAVRGELRSHARANILPGVISARIGLKSAMAHAERVITRYAEPLSALWLSDQSIAAPLLDNAWRKLIACSGHDSITGCGSDETAQQVAARIAEAGQIGQAVVDLVSSTLADATARGSLTVVNPSPFTRTGLVLADLPEDRASLITEDGVRVPAQRLWHEPTLLDETLTDDLTQLLGRVHDRELFGQEIVSWTSGDGVFDIVVGRHGATPYDYDTLRADVLAAAAARPGPWTVRTLAEPVVTVAAHVTVPPLGRTVLRTVAPHVRHPATAGRIPPADASVPDESLLDESLLDNGLLRVAAAPDGTLTLTGPGGQVGGVGRIVSGGDVGDTYNHAPPAQDRLLDSPTHVEIEVVHEGPLVSVLEITRGYRWPVAATPDARSGTDTDAVIHTRAELRAGEPFLRLTVTFDNPARDHRVRWHAPAEARESFAEGQYAVVRRGRTSEGGCGEEPLPTFPAHGFVAAGGLGVLLEQVTEYELTASDLALTLVRSVGYLSRNRNPYRDEPAGPQLPTPDAQTPGPVTARFAVLPVSEGWAGLPRLAEEYRHDLLAIPGALAAPPTVLPGPSGPSGPPGSPGLPGSGSSGLADFGGIEVVGEGVTTAALRRRGDWLELRLVAEHPTATAAVLRGAITEARLADLLGDPLMPLEVHTGEVRLPLRAWEIATVQIMVASDRKSNHFRSSARASSVSSSSDSSSSS